MSRRRADASLLGFAVLALTLTSLGCQRKAGDAPKTQSGVAVAAAADSGSVATPADSASAEAKQKKGGLFGLFGSKDKGGKDGKKEEAPVPVEMARVEIRDLPTYLASTATLEAEKNAEVVAKISGQIREILVEEGDRVREGQVLARLDGQAEQVALEEAAARAGMLQRDFERTKSLRERDLASEKDMSNVQSQWEQAEAQRKGRALDVEYTRITAPFAGRVSRRMVAPGQNVSPGTALFSVVDPEPLLANIYLPEKDVARIRIGQEVRVSPDTEQGPEYRGTVLRISPVVDERTGTLKVTCQIGETMSAAEAGRTEWPLRPGSFVRVKLQTGVRNGAFVLPKRALVSEGGSNYVYKAVADSVMKTPIMIGATDDRVIEVVSGLEAGDEVVTVGQGGLRSGAKVRRLAVTPTPTPTTESTDDAGN